MLLTPYLYWCTRLFAEFSGRPRDADRLDVHAQHLWTKPCSRAHEEVRLASEARLLPGKRWLKKTRASGGALLRRLKHRTLSCVLSVLHEVLVAHVAEQIHGAVRNLAFNICDGGISLFAKGRCSSRSWAGLALSVYHSHPATRSAPHTHPATPTRTHPHARRGVLPHAGKAAATVRGLTASLVDALEPSPGLPEAEMPTKLCRRVAEWTARLARAHVLREMMTVPRWQVGTRVQSRTDSGDVRRGEVVAVKDKPLSGTRLVIDYGGGDEAEVSPHGGATVRILPPSPRQCLACCERPALTLFDVCRHATLCHACHLRVAESSPGGTQKVVCPICRRRSG